MEPIYFKVPILSEETIRVEHWDLDHFYNPMHFHEECQLTYIIEGSGNVFVGSTVEKFQTGEAFLFGKNLPHVLRSSEEYYLNNPTLHAKAISIFLESILFFICLKQYLKVE
ncbi:MAG: cupin domain-containing protein [Flammeovirgaceae bacterium]|nr:cupin domain-containing protein [Flammeovirgaceae bacterium]